MKTNRLRYVGLALAAVAGLWMRPATAAESYVVVKLCEMDRRVGYQVMSATELKELEKKILLEKKTFSLAIQEAGKAWRADEETKGSTFPGVRLSPRSIVGSPERFDTLEKAEARLSKYSEAEDRKKDNEKKNPQWGSGNKKNPQKDKKDEERERKKEFELQQAMDLVRTKIDELVAKAATPAAGGGEKTPDAKKPAPDQRKDAVNAGLKAL